MMWLIVGIGLALTLGYVIVETKIVRLILSIFESSPTFMPAVGCEDDEAEILTIETTDGLKLSACLYRRSAEESRGVVIFCPEFGSNKWSWKNYCLGLWESGFDILSFDFRNQGESDRIEEYQELHWLTQYELVDVKSVIQFVRSHEDLGERPIGLFGVSRGGAAALAAGADSEDVELIVSDSGFSTQPMMMFYVDRWVKLYAPQWIYNLVPRWHTEFTLKIVKIFSQWSRRCEYVEVLPRLRQIKEHQQVLLIAGDRDSFVDLKLSRQLERALGASCRELWIIEGAKHNSGNLVVPDEYQARIEAFFSEMSPVHVQPLQVTEEATA